MGPTCVRGGDDEPVVVDAGELAGMLRGEPGARERFTRDAHRIMAELVRGGAAIGWAEPPSYEEVAALLDHLLAEAPDGNAGLRTAWLGGRLVGLGYWLRYARPTLRPHADAEKIAVDADAQHRGIGRALTLGLIGDARAAGVEVLTLDARGDNARAHRLYRSLGFTEYGRLPGFVAVGERRYDRVCFLLDLREQG